VDVDIFKNRTESHRPRATRFKAPPHHRSAGHPARGDTDRRQPQRRHSASSAGRGDPAHQRQAWPTTIEASGRSRRQSLRPRQISTSTTCRRHCYRNRSARSASRQRTRENTLGRGANHFVASQLSPATHPLRTARFHPRSLHENRLLHHLLAKIEQLILLRPLNMPRTIKSVPALAPFHKPWALASRSPTLPDRRVATKVQPGHTGRILPSSIWTQSL